MSLGPITLGHYLSLGGMLFALSVIGIYLNRRNLIVLAVNNPELTVMDTTADFFKKVATKARVQVHFKGTHDDRPREADRSVMVEKLSNGWKVVEIITDRRKSGG